MRKGEDKRFYGRVAVTAVTAILLVLLYGVIFSFSQQDGDTSGTLSYQVTAEIIQQVDKVTGKNWSAEMKAALTEYWEHPVRKLAHFSEYALVGLLVLAMFLPWKKKGKKLYLAVVLWVFLSACADELHQRFIPDRSGNMIDVLLDTCGGLFGMVLCSLVHAFFVRMSSRLRKGHSKRNRQ